MLPPSKFIQELFQFAEHCTQIQRQKEREIQIQIHMQCNAINIVCALDLKLHFSLLSIDNTVFCTGFWICNVFSLFCVLCIFFPRSLLCCIPLYWGFIHWWIRCCMLCISFNLVLYCILFSIGIDTLVSERGNTQTNFYIVHHRSSKGKTQKTNTSEENKP